ncbi:MAG: lytic transglycosylase domain-containing protein [Betaproteobacteria bacterium]|nr:lytic transglycosylase domain-containing protein [Betaproteobacteria bacterium]
MNLPLTQADLLELAEHAGAQHGLAPALLLALIQTESGGNPWAWNPEPHYRWFWDVRRERSFRVLTAAEIMVKTPPPDFSALAGDRDQEWWGQQASWGLMQVMGAVAREHGYRAPYLTALCEPLTNLEYGARHLARLRVRYLRDHGWDGVIAAYNAGSPRRSEAGPYLNQGYVDSVRKNLGGVPL